MVLRQKIKISFVLVLLSWLTSSSVLGITQNESVRIAGFAHSGFSRNDTSHASANAVYHITNHEKEQVIYENEEEDNKEKTLDYAFMLQREAFLPHTDQRGRTFGDFSDQTVSLNILYCVFRI